MKRKYVLPGALVVILIGMIALLVTLLMDDPARETPDRPLHRDRLIRSVPPGKLAARAARLKEKQSETTVEVGSDELAESAEEAAEIRSQVRKAAYSSAIAAAVTLVRGDLEITPEIAAEFKEEFDAMDAGQRVEHVHEALNLFDDDYLPFLEAIAVDVHEPPEVLEKVMDDLGNRDRDKVRPIFEKVAATSGHARRSFAKEWLADHP